MSLRVILAVLCLSLSGCASRALSFDPREYSVVVANEKQFGTGTLIEIGHKVYVLTAAHVVGKSKEVDILVPYIERGKIRTVTIRARVLGATGGHFDLALLKPSDTIPDRRPAPRSRHTPSVGERLIFCGLPSRSFGTGLVTTGTLVSEGCCDVGASLIADAAVIPGCSGGGVYTEGGRLIGVVTAATRGVTLVWFTSSEMIRAFIWFFPEDTPDAP